MALSDLAVFSEYSYAALIETIAQQIELFNGASRGCISLQAGANQGDYSENAFYKRIAGLVRRRNAYGSGTVASKKLEHLIDTMVKVAAGTPPVALDPGQFRWIQQNPEEAGAAMGQQLAQDMLADMLNVGIIGAYAALVQVTAIKTDVTGATDKLFTAPNMVSAVAKFGDRANDIVAWLIHSAPLHSFYGTAVANATSLFTYGTVNVVADPFGRIFVVTDAPGLVTAGSPNKYNNLGLVADAIRVEQNNDFDENMQTVNGDENIQRTYQAEWSYNLGIKGFAWDKGNGGKSPNDAAIATSGNWDKYASSDKDIAGIVLITN
jgi:hypothetical protein